jgi:Na+/serine symporter
MHDALLLIVEKDNYRHFRGIHSVNKIVHGAHFSAFALKAISMALLMLKILTNWLQLWFLLFTCRCWIPFGVNPLYLLLIFAHSTGMIC